MSTRILIVYDVSYPHVEGGGQRRLYEISERLSKLGFSIDWLCFKTWSGDDVLFDAKNSNIKYIGLPGFKGLYRGDGSRRRFEPVEFLTALIKAKVNYSEYKIVWSGQWPLLHMLLWAAIPATLGSARLIIDYWEIWGRTWLTYSKGVGFIGAILERFIIRRVGRIGFLVVISPKALLEAKSIAPSAHIRLINNGINLSQFGVRKIDSTKVSDVIYLGRLKNHKRVDLLLEALSILKHQHDYDLKLNIIGDGPELIPLKEMAKKLCIDKNVYFLGAVDSNSEVAEYLLGSKIFVNPSTKEGGGSITLFEAFAAGLPVIGFNCKDGIDPSLLIDGHNGILLDDISSESLAYALEKILKNEDHIARLKSNVLESAKQYDWDHIANEYKEYFNFILKK